MITQEDQAAISKLAAYAAIDECKKLADSIDESIGMTVQKAGRAANRLTIMMDVLLGIVLNDAQIYIEGARGRSYKDREDAFHALCRAKSLEYSCAQVPDKADGTPGEMPKAEV